MGAARSFVNDGAGGRTRTDMSLTSPDFESGAYTNFATPASGGTIINRVPGESQTGGSCAAGKNNCRPRTPDRDRVRKMDDRALGIVSWTEAVAFAPR